MNDFDDQLSIAQRGLYDSERPTPKLYDCLRVTLMGIETRYEVRGEKISGVKCEDAFEDIHHALFEQGVTARDLGMFPPLSPEADVALELSMAYWMEAEQAYDQGDNDRCWAALLEAKYFLGMASGPVTRFESNAKGGRKRADAFQVHRNQITRWLLEYENDRFKSLSEAITAIMPRYKEFENKIRQNRPRLEADAEKHRAAGKKVKMQRFGLSSNPEQLISRWCRSENYPEFRQAFVRVVKGGISRGRKKKA